MYCHIVLISLREPLTAADRAAITEHCRVIAAEVQGVISMQFMTNSSKRSPQFTHAFVARFPDAAAHDRYQTAPQHIPLKHKMAELAREMIVLDYEQPLV